jgi:hypothetical protein
MVAPKRRRPDCAADDLSPYALVQTLANSIRTNTRLTTAASADVISQRRPLLLVEAEFVNASPPWVWRKSRS